MAIWSPKQQGCEGDNWLEARTQMLRGEGFQAEGTASWKPWRRLFPKIMACRSSHLKGQAVRSCSLAALSSQGSRRQRRSR